MTIENTKDVLRKLYLARRNHKAAIKAFREKIKEIGSCEYVWENGSKYCYYEDRSNDRHDGWCDSCRALKSLHDDYVRKAHKAGYALSRAIKLGKQIHEVSDDHE